MAILISLFLTFLKIGLFTLGSGYSMLVLAQRYIVDTYRWLTLQELTDVVAISEVTPGPFIINLATFVGTKVAGFKGAIAATLGLVAIPFLALYVIALEYQRFKNNPFLENFLYVIRPIAIGFIIVAILNLFRASIPDLKSALILITVIFLTYILKINPIAIILGGIVLGIILSLPR